jgi:hypothetical protein
MYPNPIDSLQPWMVWTMLVSLAIIFLVVVYLAYLYQRPSPPRLTADQFRAMPLAMVEGRRVEVEDGGLSSHDRGALTIAGFVCDRGVWRRRS